MSRLKHFYLVLGAIAIGVTALAEQSLLPHHSFEELLELDRSLSLNETRPPEIELELLLTRFHLADEYSSRQKIHSQQLLLKLISETCNAALARDFKQWEGVSRTLLIYLCWMNEAERINYLSSVSAYLASSRLEAYSQLAQQSASPLTLEDRLYAEGRIYSALPKLYGQNFKKALVSLQMLSRLKNSSLTEPWIQRIRQLQGNVGSDDEPQLSKSIKQWQNTDGKNFGLFPMVYGSSPQGFGLQLRIQDDAIGDSERGFRGRVYGTHRGSLGAETKFVDRVSIDETTLLASAHFLYGIQEFHGLGIHSPKDSTDLYHTLGRVSVLAQKKLDSDFYFQLGWRLQSAHLRRIEGGTFNQVAIKGSSNSFDSGAVAELGFDSRDSAFDPYLGRLIYLRGHFPVAGILSSDSYQKWWVGWDEYLKLGLRYTLKVSLAIIDTSAGAPFWDYAQLSGSVAVPGISLTRFQEHDLLAAWTELRIREWDPITVFCFFNLATVASDFNSLFRTTLKGGFGLGGEMKLSRFRPRAVRAEVGSFGSEFVFKASLGMPIE